MRYVVPVWLMVAALPGMAAAQDFEIAFSFYLQPDSSGANTENRFIKLEDGELQLEAHNAVENLYTDRDATRDEVDDLIALAQAQVASVAFAAGPRIDYPHVEVQIEFDGNNVAMELDYVFAPGTVPQVFVDLQERFFADAFR
jgi:hypothetical protein